MVFDHGTNCVMSDTEEMAISKFKATCLAVLERVRRTGKPVRITRFGKPVAEIVPPRPAETKQRKLGFMEGELGIVGDIVRPIYSPEELDEIEAEWLRNWDVIEAKGREIEARNMREALIRRGKRPKNPAE